MLLPPFLLAASVLHHQSECDNGDVAEVMGYFVLMWDSFFDWKEEAEIVQNGITLGRAH